MAKRYIYFVNENNQFQKEQCSFKWFSGFSVSQYQKSSQSLIASFHRKHPKLKIIEISSASSENFGIAASALNLTITLKSGKQYTVEQLFQSGKVFEHAGSQRNLLKLPSKLAKKQVRTLNKNDKLVSFNLFNHQFAIEPQTFFYNWLYMHALQQQHNVAIKNKILQYDAFSDIYFNPQTSINSQAEACARFVSLKRRNLLNEALKNQQLFKYYVYGVPLSEQMDLFGQIN